MLLLEVVVSVIEESGVVGTLDCFGNLWLLVPVTQFVIVNVFLFVVRWIVNI